MAKIVKVRKRVPVYTAIQYARPYKKAIAELREFFPDLTLQKGYDGTYDLIRLGTGLLFYAGIYPGDWVIVDEEVLYYNRSQGNIGGFEIISNNTMKYMYEGA